MDYGGGERMTVKYVKVSGGKFQCHCGVTTEKGILWDYPGDNYRHFEPICGFCIDDIFKDYDRWSVPTVTSEEIENTQANPELVTAEEGDPKSTLDLLANLARRVTELERKLGEYARKIDGIEADIQNINVDLGTVEETMKELERKFENLESRQKRLIGRIADTEEKFEMILDDIVTLDERTQPLVSKSLNKPFGEESPFATVATIPTFKYSELIGKTLKIYGGRDGEYATVFGYDESTGESYVLFNGKEGEADE
jgi:archaellum component FlaC